ncbi:MAG: hypothetical protein GKR94_00990 [Gammaproteobacteria bacterium]|nr:hypothetical protein [Gammaproteobacteria bacterium]
MTTDNANPRRRGTSMRTWMLAGAIALGGALAGGAVTAAATAYAHGGFGKHGGWHGHHGEPNAERAKAHAAEKAEWVLGRVDASDEQKERVVAIINRAVDGMMPLLTQHREHHASIVQLLSGDAIDKDALERLRKAEVALLDSGSQVLTQAIAEAAAVLTAAQRKELHQAIAKFRH